MQKNTKKLFSANSIVASGERAMVYIAGESIKISAGSLTGAPQVTLEGETIVDKGAITADCLTIRERQRVKNAGVISSHGINSQAALIETNHVHNEGKLSNE